MTPSPALALCRTLCPKLGSKARSNPPTRACPWLQLTSRGPLGFTRARDELKNPFSACSPSKEHQCCESARRSPRAHTWTWLVTGSKSSSRTSPGAQTAPARAVPPAQVTNSPGELPKPAPILAAPSGLPHPSSQTSVAPTATPNPVLPPSPGAQGPSLGIQQGTHGWARGS